MINAPQGNNERSNANDRAFAEAIREKFALEEDNDQDILDQHVSRVWKDQTPHRSPGTMSPCPPIPSRRRTTTHDSGMVSDGAMSLSMLSPVSTLFVLILYSNFG